MAARKTTKKGASKKTTSAKKATAKKATPRKSTSKKGAAKKAASKKATSKKTASKKTASKKAASKKATSKKTASKKTASKKAASKKATSKKAASKKSSSKKSTKKTTAGAATSKKATPKKATAKKAATAKQGVAKGGSKSTKTSTKGTRPTTTKKKTVSNTKKKTPTIIRRGPMKKKVPVGISEAKAKKAMKEIPETAFSAATGTGTNQKFSKKDLDKFNALIQGFRDESATELEELTEQLREMAANEGADDNSYSLHMAEQGTDAMEREKTFLQAQRTSDYIKKLDEALVRISNKAFGICRVCGLRLDSRRLSAVPVTQVCTVYKNTSKPCAPGKHYLETFGEDEE